MTTRRAKSGNRQILPTSMLKKIIKKIITPVLRLPSLPESFFYFGFNGRVAIEVTNACNLRCRLCPTWQHMKRKPGFMSLENFKKIIDENKDIFKRINLIFAGEPLLNKDVFKMTAYAEENGVEVLLSTNTTLFDDDKIKELFDSGLSILIVCLDGATKEVHEQYRQGSDFEAVKKNIERICRLKKEKGLEKPDDPRQQGAPAASTAGHSIFLRRQPNNKRQKRSGSGQRFTPVRQKAGRSIPGALPGA